MNEMPVCEIGCGDVKVIKGSIAIDVRKTHIVDVLADARSLPFKDCSVGYVYASHVIEHFSHRDVDNVLKEWVRILRPGGTIELRCPDFRARAALSFISPGKGNIVNVFGEQDYPENYHKCGFSYGILKSALQSQGIIMVRRVFDGYKGIPFLPCDLHVKGIKK